MHDLERNFRSEIFSKPNKKMSKEMIKMQQEKGKKTKGRERGTSRITVVVGRTCFKIVVTRSKVGLRVY